MEKQLLVLMMDDRKMRMLWTYVSLSKEAPVNNLQMMILKFKSANPHQAVCTDEDKALGKSDYFPTMVQRMDFLLN